MPKLNYKKLPYKKIIKGVTAPKTNSFYEPIKCENDKYKTIYRGYYTYDYFGDTVRRHEGDNDECKKHNT